MQELINLIVQKTGISQEQAQTAVQTVVDHIKAKLPPGFASQVDAFIEGGSGGIAGEARNALGNLFG